MRHSLFLLRTEALLEAHGAPAPVSKNLVSGGTCPEDFAMPDGDPSSVRRCKRGQKVAHGKHQGGGAGARGGGGGEWVACTL